MKGYFFIFEILFVNDFEMVEKFKNGDFIMIYLLFSDYYCVYMLCDVVLKKMIYVLGELFFVNLFLVEYVLNLFVCNEWVICEFEIVFGLIV